MAIDGPAVRSRHMQTFLEVVDRLEPADRDAIRQAMPPETLAAIEASSSVGWLPVEMNLTLTRVVSERLGPQRSRRFFRDLLLAGFETPLLGSFVKGAIRLAGSNPGFGLKWVPKGFGLVFRDCGSWETRDVTSASAVIEATNLPASMVADRLWAESVAGSLEAVFDIVPKQGSIEVASIDTAGKRVVYQARWSG